MQGEYLACVTESIFGLIWSEFQVYVSFLPTFLQTIGNSVNVSTVRDLDWNKRAIRHGSFNIKCESRLQICLSSLLCNLILHLLRFFMWGTCCFSGLADKAAQSELSFSSFCALFLKTSVLFFHSPFFVMASSSKSKKQFLLNFSFYQSYLIISLLIFFLCFLLQSSSSFAIPFSSFLKGIYKL